MLDDEPPSWKGGIPRTCLTGREETRTSVCSEGEEEGESQSLNRGNRGRGGP